MKKILMMALAMTMAVAFTARAEDWTWAGSTEGTQENWADASVWSGGDGGTYPGETTNQGIGAALISGTTNVLIDSAIPFAMTSVANYELGSLVGNSATVTVQAGGDVNFGGANIYFGRTGGAGALVVDGGSFIWSGTQRLSFGENGGGNQSVTSLEVKNGGELLLSQGGSNVRLEAYSWGSAITQFTGTLADGLIQIDTTHATGFGFSHPGVNQNITFTHADGILRATGDKVTAWNDLITSGGLVADTGLSWKDGGAVYNADLDITELRVIPEPGTIALLGLAGLALLIRRRFVK